MTEQTPSPLDRYQKQIAFQHIGKEGQQRLVAAHVSIVGCGALGSSLAETLARAGVGKLTIIDRDFVDLSNLQRQHLFDEQDVQQHIPKAIAAQKRLSTINSNIEVLPVVANLSPDNIEQLLGESQLILDGTDNYETRFLINDFSLESNIPWISAGVLAANGQVMTIIPHRTPCYRCLLHEPPPTTETCDSAGVIGPIVNLISALQATRALKWITSNGELYDTKLTAIDIWQESIQQVDLSGLLKDNTCPACQKNERSWLHRQRGSQATTLCGRNSVQISPHPPRQLDLAQVQSLWNELGQTNLNPFLLHFIPTDRPDIQINLFTDGRAIIQGTEDIPTAQSLYNRFLAS